MHISSRNFSLSRKKINKKQKIKNGNGTLSIGHWNAGSKHWQRKREDIELLLSEKNYDLLFVSESNLFSSTPDWQKEINGYKLMVSKSMEQHGYTRIVLLVKEGTNVHLLPNFMESDLAMIWVRVGNNTRTPLHIGGIYRQHKLPNQGIMSNDELIANQRERWDRMTSNWARAAEGARCICLGDTNLDFARWNDPDPSLLSMVNRTKQLIENKGSRQIISEVTRSWNLQRDSISGPNLAKL